MRRMESGNRVLILTGDLNFTLHKYTLKDVNAFLPLSSTKGKRQAVETLSPNEGKTLYLALSNRPGNISCM